MTYFGALSHHPWHMLGIKSIAYYRPSGLPLVSRGHQNRTRPPPVLRASPAARLSNGPTTLDGKTRDVWDEPIQQKNRETLVRLGIYSFARLFGWGVQCPTDAHYGILQLRSSLNLEPRLPHGRPSMPSARLGPPCSLPWVSRSKIVSVQFFA